MTVQQGKVIRSCAFCGATADISAEHVWPDWLRPYALHCVGRYRFGLVNETVDGVNRDFHAASFTQTVRRVCRPCNNGWMSRIEGQAKQRMIPMLQRKTILLDGPAQHDMATWLYKTALVVALTINHEATTLPSLHYRRLHERGDLLPQARSGSPNRTAERSRPAAGSSASHGGTSRSPSRSSEMGTSSSSHLWPSWVSGLSWIRTSPMQRMHSTSGRGQ